MRVEKKRKESRDEGASNVCVCVCGAGFIEAVAWSDIRVVPNHCLYLLMDRKKNGW